MTTCKSRGRRGAWWVSVCVVKIRRFAWQARYLGHSGLYTSHLTLDTPHSAVYTPHSDSTLHTFTLDTLHSTLYTLHFALHTLHFTLQTLHFALHTLHFTLRSTLHTLHSTLYTRHFALHNPHFIAYTLNPPLNTPLSSLSSHSILCTPAHVALHSLHWYGSRGKMYKTVEIICFTKMFYVPAFGFIGFSFFSHCWLCISTTCTPIKHHKIVYLVFPLHPHFIPLIFQ